MNKDVKKPKETEIVVSLSAVLPTGEFENFKPLYSIKEVYEGEIDKEEKSAKLRKFIQKMLDADYQEVIRRRIEKMRADIKLEIIEGILMPSVTSILNWQGIDYDPIKLQQYASRGTIPHKVTAVFFETGINKLKEKGIIKDSYSIEELLKYGEWKNPEDIPELATDVLIVKQGELGLDWNDCNPKGFLEKHGNRMKIIDFEKKIINMEYKYFGTMDIYGEWEGKKAVMDWKTSSNIKETTAFKQMSAYAYGLEEKVERLVILPLNPSNKSGFGNPIITEDIDRYFNLFLQDRQNFKKVYGI